VRSGAEHHVPPARIQLRHAFGTAGSRVPPAVLRQLRDMSRRALLRQQPRRLGVRPDDLRGYTSRWRRRVRSANLRLPGLRLRDGGRRLRRDAPLRKLFATLDLRRGWLRPVRHDPGRLPDRRGRLPAFDLRLLPEPVRGVHRRLWRFGPHVSRRIMFLHRCAGHVRGRRPAVSVRVGRRLQTGYVRCLGGQLRTGLRRLRWGAGLWNVHAARVLRGWWVQPVRSHGRRLGRRVGHPSFRAASTRLWTPHAPYPQSRGCDPWGPSRCLRLARASFRCLRTCRSRPQENAWRRTGLIDVNYFYR
jgi:hypothetical protein